MLFYFIYINIFFIEKNIDYIGSHNKSFNGIINCLAKAKVVSYEIAHLNMGGPSNRSVGEVRKSNLIEVSSIIWKKKFVKDIYMCVERERKRRTDEKTPIRFISISVNSPGIVN